MKLKTLQDLICWRDKEDHSETWVRANLLKQEAIKWVKECKCGRNCISCNWIKHFFNITEEDLE